MSTTKGVTTELSRYAVVISSVKADLTTDEQLAFTKRTKRGKKPIAVPEVAEITQAVSLQEILNAGPREDFTFTETPNSSKIPSVLPHNYLDGSYQFAGGLVPAVYAIEGGGVGYVRPVRKATTDVNAGDIFQTDGRPLVLTIHKNGFILAAKINATPDKPTTARPVSFSAKIETDEKLAYEWNFTGSSSVQSRKATPTYQYKKKDSYAVNLSVRGDDGSYGRASTATVKVGNPPKPPPKPETGNGGGAGAGTGTGGGGGTGYIPPYLPTTPPVVDPPAEQNPPPEEQQQTPVDDGLESVEGFVLAGAGAEEGDSIPGTQSASQPTQADELSTNRKISGAVIGALAVILLLGLGAEIETRWVSTRLSHLRRRT